MKTAAFAIALLMSGAAIAGGTGSTTASNDPVDHSKMDKRTMSTTADAELSATQAPDLTTTTTVTTSPTLQTTALSTPAGDPVAEPSNANPERDARGIPVISASARVPDGFNGVSGSAMGGPLLDPATGAELGDDASYPACTASLTDNCVQTYERGRSS